MPTESAVMNKQNAADSNASQYVLLFELEGAALDGRAKLFDAAKSVFKSAGIKLTEKDFARYCTHDAVPAIIEKLVTELGGEKISDDAKQSILANYTSSFSNGTKVHPLFTELLKETTKRGIAAHALSILPEETAQAVLDQSGLSQKGVVLHSFAQTERHFPRVDCWMKVCRQVARSARGCIAVAGCRDSGKSALSSGMRCVIIPDQFTSYQDFGGTDAVLENAEDYSISELVDSLI